jgi:predicted nucleic acid-binding protein
MKMAVLDANVLFSAPVRDYFLHLAELKMFIPKWTEIIHEEWMTSLMKIRRDISHKSLNAAKIAMNNAFPDADIAGFDQIITELLLPDTKDRHVLAAAISAGAGHIVTFNTRDFPKPYLETFGIRPLHPDEFISELIKENSDQCMLAINNQSKRLKHPPKSVSEVLSTLKNCGLYNSVDQLKLVIQSKK